MEVEDRPAQRLGLVCLSSLIIKASRQASDSVPMLDREHSFVPKGRVLQWFEQRIEEITAQLDAFSAAAPHPAPRVYIRGADARDRDESLVGSVAGIITSPPYPGVYDYVDHHRRRYAMLGMDPALAERKEIGRRRLVRAKGWMSASWHFKDDMAEAMRGWHDYLAPDGHVVLVIGDGQHEDGAIRVVPLIEGAAKASGFTVAATVSQPRPTFGQAAKRNTQRDEHLIWLDKTT